MSTFQTWENGSGTPIEETSIIGLCPTTWRYSESDCVGNCKWSTTITYKEYLVGGLEQRVKEHLHESQECNNFLRIRKVHDQ